MHVFTMDFVRRTPKKFSGTRAQRENTGTAGCFGSTLPIISNRKPPNSRLTCVSHATTAMLTLSPQLVSSSRGRSHFESEQYSLDFPPGNNFSVPRIFVDAIETMECLNFDASNNVLSVQKKPIPKPGPNEVLIRVAYSGICGTDIHILNGSFPCKKSGVTLGHEFSGLVEQIGCDVKGFKIGHRVAVDPSSGCNNCDYCHSGIYHFCENGGINGTIGIFRDGGWATHTLVPENQVHTIPDDIEMAQAALTEPLSCVAHGWDIIHPVYVGARTLVIGSGIIGLLWACMLHLHGLRKTVTISEPLEKRREPVNKLELDYEVTSPTELSGRSFDLAVDCSGSGPAMEAAITLLRRGGQLCVFGVANPKATIAIHPYEIYMKELKIVGVNINPFTFIKGLALVRAMADRYLNYNNLGVRVYKLSEHKEALADLRSGLINKAVFRPE